MPLPSGVNPEKREGPGEGNLEVGFPRLVAPAQGNKPGFYPLLKECPPPGILPQKSPAVSFVQPTLLLNEAGLVHLRHDRKARGSGVEDDQFN